MLPLAGEITECAMTFMAGRREGSRAGRRITRRRAGMMRVVVRVRIGAVSVAAAGDVMQPMAEQAPNQVRCAGGEAEETAIAATERHKGTNTQMQVTCVIVADRDA